jgi:hypothetical protein
MRPAEEAELAESLAQGSRGAEVRRARLIIPAHLRP